MLGYTNDIWEKIYFILSNAILKVSVKTVNIINKITI